MTTRYGSVMLSLLLPLVAFSVDLSNASKTEADELTVSKKVTEVVHLDIKPRACPNPLNVKNIDNPQTPGRLTQQKGAVFPVAILGTPGLDVRTIRISSLRLAGVVPMRYDYLDVTSPLPSGDDCECHSVAPDGYMDLSLKFDKSEIVRALGAVNKDEIVSMLLAGELNDGTPIEGVDCVLIRHGTGDPPATSNVPPPLCEVVDIDCPKDSTIVTPQTFPQWEMFGFKITNSNECSTTFSYAVSTEGPGTINNLGNPASLSGVTPLLLPGESFVPPRAAVDFPLVDNVPVAQETKYVVWVTSDPAAADSCHAILYIDAPIPVAFQGLSVTDRGGALEIVWHVRDALEVLGYNIYRSDDGGVDFFRLNASGPIAGTARSYLDRAVLPGREYIYRVGAVESSGETLSLPQSASVRPLETRLDQNRPNPFNPITTISFVLAEPLRVQVTVYDASGRLVKQLYDGPGSLGANDVQWNGTNANGEKVGSGVYYYALKAGHYRQTRKMVLLK